MSPAPNHSHQTVVDYALHVLLFEHRTRERRTCIDGARPMSSSTITRFCNPMCSYVRRERRSILKNRVIGPPDLVGRNPLAPQLSPRSSRQAQSLR